MRWVGSHPRRTHLGLLSIWSWDKRLLGCLHLQWVVSLPRQSTTLKPTPNEPSRGHITTRGLPFLTVMSQNMTGPTESRWLHVCSQNIAGCYCRPLFSNPLLQFSQCKLHLFLSCGLIALASARTAAVLFTHKPDTPTNDSACRRRRLSFMSCVYLGDLNPAGTRE